ncbi:MAG: gliding motility-associated ABC transporter substrate-binding protein GldG [Chitinophagaceae bacterium]|nr:gliding motility-associated ABC transporter substrate-binding protein GldG [Chitinophagaceae bacterium]
MEQLLNKKYGGVAFVLLIVLINCIAAAWHFRIDLTAEKRYTISRPVKQMLRNLDGTVTITVFLSGEMPAGFKKLANSTQELLQEFKEYGRTNIKFNFAKPGDGMDEEARTAFLDSLGRLGLRPMNVKAQAKEGEGQEERYVYPGALINYKDNVTAVDLLQGQSAVNGINSLNNAEALLEYKFAHSIHKLTREKVPLIGYLAGNGQPVSYNIYSLVENAIKPNYEFRILPLDSVTIIPPIFDAIMIVKPTVPFTEAQKLRIDQYIMHGGKVIWMIDNLYAEMDSLQRSQSEFIAFDRGLRLEDMLFKYGARINLDLVQGLNADKFGMVVGDMGGKPQMEMIPWPYFPLLQNTNGHPIAKNLDYITTQFPHSVDTVKSAGVRKTVLLSTSGESRILNTPAKVMLQSIKTEEDMKAFSGRDVPVALLLEGRFSSLYANRIPAAVKDSMSAIGYPFLPADTADNKMIVIADGDIVLNAVSQNEGPLLMGQNMFSKYVYANQEFIVNCLEYLTDNSGILETRSKDYTLRLLDKSKVEEHKTLWQAINIMAPILLVIIFGISYQVIRKKKFSK